MSAGPKRSRSAIGVVVRRRLRLSGLLAALAALTLASICALSGSTPFALAGFTAKISNSTNTVATAPYFKCSDAEAADKGTALFQYYLNDATGSTTAADSSGNAANGTYQGSMTTSTATPLACSRDTGGAYVLNGTTSYISTPTKYTNPTTFSEEVWFKTTVAAGKLIGFGSAQTGSSSQYDRHIYLSTTGALVFGIYNGGIKIITTPKAYNDGQWHQVVGTLSPTAGMSLYVDGSLIGTNTATTPENTSGYWRIGYDNTSGWSNNGSNYYFNGSMRYAAVYSSVLTAQQISNHYAAGQ